MTGSLPISKSKNASYSVNIRGAKMLSHIVSNLAHPQMNHLHTFKDSKPLVEFLKFKHELKAKKFHFCSIDLFNSNAEASIAMMYLS